MRNYTAFAFALAATAFGTACSFDDGRSFDADGRDLRDRLATRQTLLIQPPSEVGVTALNAAGAPVPCVQPTVEGGRTLVRADADDLLLVDKLDVSLSDVYVPASETTYPTDLTLTDVEVRLGTQLVVAPEWSFDGSFAVGRGRADLLLDWSVLDTDGEVLPLATQLLRDVEFDVFVEIDSEDRILADVNADVLGSLWDFSIIELTDLRMDITARTLER